MSGLGDSEFSVNFGKKLRQGMFIPFLKVAPVRRTNCVGV